jgi:hypothetical protein
MHPLAVAAATLPSEFPFAAGVEPHERTESEPHKIRLKFAERPKRFIVFLRVWRQAQEVVPLPHALGSVEHGEKDLCTSRCVEPAYEILTVPISFSSLHKSNLRIINQIVGYIVCRCFGLGKR